VEDLLFATLGMRHDVRRRERPPLHRERHAYRLTLRRAGVPCLERFIVLAARTHLVTVITGDAACGQGRLAHAQDGHRPRRQADDAVLAEDAFEALLEL